MRHLGIFVAVGLFAAGCGTKDCKDGTLLLALSFDAESAAADSIMVQVTTSDGQTRTGTRSVGALGSSQTLEISFAAGYPAGMGVTVVVTALQGGGEVGTGTASTTLSGKCARIPVSVAGTGAGLDLSSGDLAGADLSSLPDLTIPADLATCVPSTTSQTVWVDGSLGVDDTSHGNAPGACALKTINYALSHFTGRVNVAAGTYSAGTNVEGFPILLTGTQILDCDPTNSGTKAIISGSSNSFGGIAATVIINGTLNQLLKCEVTGPAGPSFASCLAMNTTGSHLVDHCSFHDCAASNGDGVSGGNGTTNFANYTMSNNVITNVGNCFNQIGANVTIKMNTCTASNDWINACQPTTDTGCGNTLLGGTTCNGCGAPFCANAIAACP